MAKQYRSGLTYMMAAIMTAAPAFHVGDTIEIETLLNGRSDKNFLSDRNSIKRYVVTQLPKGTVGKVEKVQEFSKSGNTGLYITVTSGPNAGKKYWVLNRRDKRYLHKLYDNKNQETQATHEAVKLETQKDVPAVQDRQPASDSKPEGDPKPEAASQPETDREIPQKVVDLAQFVKSAGESPQADCLNAEASKPEPAPVTPTAPKVELAPEAASFFLRSSRRVQTNAPQIQALAEEITRGKTDDLSKAMAIHDWVASNIDYDTNAYFNEFLKDKPFTREYDALSVLNSTPRTAICAGYTNLALALMRASNIPAREIEGLLHYDGAPSDVSCNGAEKKKNYHGWLEVWVNGQWLPMDTTADAGTTDMKTQKFNKDPSRMFMNPETFTKSHTPCVINNYY